MKINHIGLSNMNPYNRNTNNINKENQTLGKTADKIEISTVAKEMQQISQYTTERQEKVAEIKLQVENGTYKINPQEVAKSVYRFYFQK